MKRLSVFLGEDHFVGGKGLKPISKAPLFRDEISLLYRVENKSVKSIQAIADNLIAAASKSKGPL